MKRNRFLIEYFIDKKTVLFILSIYLSWYVGNQLLGGSLKSLLINSVLSVVLLCIIMYPILGLWIVTAANLILNRGFDKHISVGPVWVLYTDIILILVFCGIVLEIMMKKRPILWKWGALESSILFFLVYCFLNAIFIGGINDVTGAIADTHNILFFIAYFLVGYLVRDLSQFKHFLWIWCIGSLILSYEPLWKLVISGSWGYEGVRRYGTGTISVLISFTVTYLIIMLTMNRFRKKALLYFFICFFGFIVFISFYRVGWLCLFIGIFVSFIFLLKPQKIKFIKGLVPLSVLAFAFVSIVLLSPAGKTVITSFNNRIEDAFSHDRSTTSGYRLIMWKSAIDKIKEHPLLGHGFGAKFEWASPQYKQKIEHTEAIHNSYLEFTLRTGLIGLSCFLLICFIFIFKMSRSIMSLNEDTPQRAYLVGLLSTFISFLVYAFFGPAFQSSYAVIFLWIVMGLGISLTRVSDQHKLILEGENGSYSL